MSEGATGNAARGPKGIARRREIVEAAERVFGRSGYWSATMAEIAGEVGISQPGLYRYFPTKRALFVEALTLRQGEVEAAVREALSEPANARERISRIAAAIQSLAAAHPEMAMLRVQAIAVAGTDEEIREAVRETLTQLFAGHEALLLQGVDDGSVDPRTDCHAIAGSIASLAFMLYAAITVEHPRAAPAEAGRSIEGLLEAISPRRIGE
jgi:AcrR family transcriptional regulator